MRSKLLSSILSALLLAGTLLPASANEPAQAQPAPDTRFGIAEGFRNPAVMDEIRPGWTRLVFSWSEIQPERAGDFRHLGLTLPADMLQRELNRGTRVAGLLQFTPAWAARDPQFGQRSVPRNLNLPFDNPENYFGRYVFETVKHYAGRINEWIIWNEPEFQETDIGAGGSFTWKGSDEEFAQLLKVGYLAAKRANPNAVVSFPGTSYWVEELAQPRRPQFYDRVLEIIKRDPAAAANGFFHDVVSLNLYRAPDDLIRVHQVFKDIQRKHGVDKPVWLTETNAMPTNDMAIPCAERHANAFPKTTMDHQAAYGIQALALAAAAGYQRIEFYQMRDGGTCQEPAVWGITRDDGSPRPVKDALRTAVRHFSGYTRATFAPLTGEIGRVSEQGSPVATWPDNPNAFVYNWQLYLVAFDKPNGERVNVLWTGDGAPRRARIRKNGVAARAVNRSGGEAAVQEMDGWWVVELPPATARGEIVVGGIKYTDPEGYYFIGGDPILIIEEGVPGDAAVTSPRLGAPGEIPREFRLFPTPADQTVPFGAPAEFYLATRGYEDFTDPISLRILKWSTQRFPNERDGSSFPIAVAMPEVINPGDTATIRVETGTAAEGGIYFFTVEASSGDIIRTADFALVIN